MLKAYLTYEKDHQEEEAVLVFAHNKREAAKIGYRQVYAEYKKDMRAHRVPEADAFLDTNRPTHPYPYIELRNMAAQRAAHLAYDGDDSCDTCGLYTMNGEFPICEGCRQCVECGCDCCKICMEYACGVEGHKGMLVPEEPKIIFEEEVTELTTEMIKNITERLKKTNQDLPRVLIGTPGEGDFWVQTQDAIVAYVRNLEEHNS